ncbi:MAG TPA: NAD(P)/FAD-dependent oxidoreductase [Gemmatimonadaceae bacterium]|nr:NAD(P)/FAD-dependent oxidoreductase [Gemmatimonadaceae bacterium]
MSHRHAYDAVVVGAGPNGLSAAIVIAQTGRSVLVLEGQSTIGGGARSAELTLPGFIHDVGSAVHPLAVGAPFFPSLRLEQHGLEWIHPPAALAHPFDDGPPAMLRTSIEETGRTLGADAERYDRLVRPLVEHWEEIAADSLGPVHVPKHPFVMGRFGLSALRSMRDLAERRFRGEQARGLMAGLGAHSIMPLTHVATASIGLVLAAVAHRAGWPSPKGGAQSISNALASYLRSLGGEIVTDTPVASLAEVPSARVVMLDLTAQNALEFGGDRFSSSYRNALSRFRVAPGVCKIDWALSAAVPWRDDECATAGTVHLGGTLEEFVTSEAAPWKGEHAERPFVLLAQPSLFDSTRAPAGSHTLWAYCHVPNGSDVDMCERIEGQIERFAPGFGDCILARHITKASELHLGNANLVGGDIIGGANTLRQLFFRPVMRSNPYKTSVKGVYLCSSSTPPGGGVHGLCGMFAARAALKELEKGRAS